MLEYFPEVLSLDLLNPLQQLNLLVANDLFQLLEVIGGGRAEEWGVFKNLETLCVSRKHGSSGQEFEDYTANS